ncbi:hypothetical protein WBJ53_23500 [Spirosoma sp. SC4-14]|uniref:hypothetical protein n=1 Tax=Spirosoma sp. SC4-14 TaxID=3128900 RepID=UPI0030CC64C0
MKTYQNEHLTILVDCGVHLLQQTWVGLPSSENFKNGSQMSFTLAQRHQIKRWLIDLQALRIFNPVDLHWFVQNWLPNATLSLPHAMRVAIVLSDQNQFAKLGADLILRASGSMNERLTSCYFTDTDSARQWLLLHN